MIRDTGTKKTSDHKPNVSKLDANNFLQITKKNNVSCTSYMYRHNMHMLSIKATKTLKKQNQCITEKLTSSHLRQQVKRNQNNQKSFRIHFEAAVLLQYESFNCYVL